MSLLQAQQALVHLPTIPEAGRLERHVAYEVPVIDDSLLLCHRLGIKSESEYET